jgi:phosphatidylserine decarboxylase
MIEVVAFMVGDIMQCYCEVKYKQPQQIISGMFLKVGQPKSLFRPGSSTVVLLLQAGRVQFAPDLLGNQAGPGISVFSQGFHMPLVETEMRVRSYIATQSRLTS